MATLVLFNWGWLLASLLLGLAMGWVAVVHRAQGVPRRLTWLLAMLAAMLVGLALARVVPGRAGYWLELWLAMLAVYLVGCAVGSGLRNWVVCRTPPAKPAP